ncbi:unnamed protein product [Adineta ricciae]|uniref:Uncharacterized protein n=1 Tax=Adineta ricciae TaxID=249248 RepID=A0A815MYF1_ADIRI|nr:unnamed protein product [Adineta ricciae]CAF1430876.1 unnamed protein product [Adineta ricciae]
MFSQYMRNRNRIFDPFESGRNIFLQLVIRFYSFRCHFIVIPLVIIYAAVHLGLAIHYFGQCPMQPMIPIYMIVHAAVHLGLIVFALIGVIVVQCIYSFHETIGIVLLVLVLVLHTILGIFSFAWLIAGSVWIFGAKADGVQGSNPDITSTYCQSHLYKAAFTLLIINYIAHGLFAIAIIAICVWGMNRKVNRSRMGMNMMNYGV